MGFWTPLFLSPNHLCVHVCVWRERKNKWVKVLKIGSWIKRGGERVVHFVKREKWGLLSSTWRFLNIFVSFFFPDRRKLSAGSNGVPGARWQEVDKQTVCTGINAGCKMLAWTKTTQRTLCIPINWPTLPYQFGVFSYLRGTTIS